MNNLTALDRAYATTVLVMPIQNSIAWANSSNHRNFKQFCCCTLNLAET